MNGIKFKYIPLYLFFFSAPFAVSSWINDFIPINFIMLAVTALYFVFGFIINKSIKLNIVEKKVIRLFIIPICLSIFGLLYKLIFGSNILYYDYVYNSIGRISLIVVNLIIILGLLSISKYMSEKSVYTLIKFYYYGLLILLFFGLWQFLHVYLNIPYINIETRDFLHSINTSSTNMLIGRRLTSLTNEPSYFAPLMIDMITLSLLLFQKRILVPLLGVFSIIFSYSVGGYLHMIILFIAFIILYSKYKGYRMNIKHMVVLLFSIGILMVIIAMNYNYIVNNVLYPILGRSSKSLGLKSSIRVFMSVMPFYWVMKEGIINGLFGFGPGSYYYLSLTTFLPNGHKVHVTSNNLFSDTVFELGYVGFITYVYLFFVLLKESVLKIYKNSYYYYSSILTIHLISSSIYRADFMQARFWIILFVILYMMRLGRSVQTQEITKNGIY